MPKITKTIVEKAEAGGPQIPVWDSEVKGLGLRVTPAGAKSFIYQYRHAGQSRRITIGKVGSIEPSKARNIAKQYTAVVAEGRDPKAEKDGTKVRALVEKQRQRQTFQTIAAEFV